ncbi:MAG TPA: hypothetical protein VI306_26175 [Pyrinomonadaceae bacterium]
MITQDELADLIEKGLGHPRAKEADRIRAFKDYDEHDALDLALIGKFGDPEALKVVYERTIEGSVPVCAKSISLSFSVFVHAKAYLLNISYELAATLNRWHAEGSSAGKLITLLRQDYFQEGAS